MTVRSTTDRRLTDTWRYALIGGGVPIPFTVGFYLLSGIGNELSLNMVFFGGLLAGYLARTGPTDIDSTAVGLHAGLIGSLHGLWLLADLFWVAKTLTGPVLFQIVGLGFVIITVTLTTVAFAALLGFFGATVDLWLAWGSNLSSTPLSEG